MSMIGASVQVGVKERSYPRGERCGLPEASKGARLVVFRRVLGFVRPSGAIAGRHETRSCCHEHCCCTNTLDYLWSSLLPPTEKGMPFSILAHTLSPGKVIQEGERGILSQQKNAEGGEEKNNIRVHHHLHIFLPLTCHNRKRERSATSGDFA